MALRIVSNSHSRTSFKNQIAFDTMFLSCDSLDDDHEQRVPTASSCKARRRHLFRASMGHNSECASSDNQDIHMMDARPSLVQMDSWTVAVCHQHFARNSTPLSTTWFPSESCSLDDIIIYPPRSISEVIDSSSASHQFSLRTLSVGEPSTRGLPADYNMSLDNIHECRPMTVNASGITERSLENPHDSSRMLTTRSRSSL